MKNLGLVVAFVGVIVATVGVTWQVATQNKSNMPNHVESNTVSGSSNVVLSGNASNTNYYEPSPSLEIPEYNGEIQPISKEDFIKENSEFKKSLDFNSFMMENDGKIVYLDIWPYYTDEDDSDPNFNRFDIPEYFSIFDVPYDIDFGGVEYLIRANEDSDFYYDPRSTSRRIKGYFKIIGVQGPRQGFMSVLIKPVDLEMVELLKK